MDLSQLLINSLLGNSSVKTLSKNSGASQDQVQKVMGLALPVLMKNMQNNVSTKDGEESLAKALAKHAENDTSDISAFLQKADLEDGNKILSHILGKDKKKVETDIAKQAGLTSNQTSNILSNIAPLLLTLLGGQSKGKSATGSLGTLLASTILGSGSGAKSGGGGLENLLMNSLGSLLGGMGGSKEPEKPTKKGSTKKATKKVDSNNVIDTLIGSLFGIDGKEK